MAPKIARRDLQDGWNSFTSNFSSFDKCMSVNECKIPFIVIVVVGSLIVLSILYCVLRCCCCGYRVCRCCCGGCGGRREKKEKKLNFAISGPSPLPHHHDDTVPQYTYLGGKVSDDSLPIMPSLDKTEWVEVVNESHEMSPVSPPDSRGRYSLSMQQTNRQLGASPLPLIHGQSRTGTPVQNHVRDVEQGHFIDHLVMERSPSRASSFYSTLMPPSRMGHRAPSPASARTHTPAPRLQTPVSRNEGTYLETPRAPFAGGGHRNTFQRAYNDVGVNPYQYNGPLRPGRVEQGAPDVNGHSRPEEWTVI